MNVLVVEKWMYWWVTNEGIGRKKLVNVLCRRTAKNCNKRTRDVVENKDEKIF